MNVNAKDIYLIASPPLDPLKLDFNGARFEQGTQPGLFVSHDVGFAINGKQDDNGKKDGLRLTIQNVDTKIEKLWLVMRYTLQKN